MSTRDRTGAPDSSRYLLKSTETLLGEVLLDDLGSGDVRFGILMPSEEFGVALRRSLEEDSEASLLMPHLLQGWERVDAARATSETDVLSLETESGEQVPTASITVLRTMGDYPEVCIVFEDI
jgi:hypothetical protein